jgi:hypothetical protein
VFAASLHVFGIGRNNAKECKQVRSWTLSARSDRQRSCVTMGRSVRPCRLGPTCEPQSTADLPPGFSRAATVRLWALLHAPGVLVERALDTISSTARARRLASAAA